MSGDTNLFFCHFEDCAQLAEAEIMIAEKSVRRNRRGREAMLLLLRYGCEELAVGKFQVKINRDNDKIVLMFQRMGFVKISESVE
jgi:RimJ/RimL family protein N-acetyltransferase